MNTDSYYSLRFGLDTDSVKFVGKDINRYRYHKKIISFLDLDMMLDTEYPDSGYG